MFMHVLSDRLLARRRRCDCCRFQIDGLEEGEEDICRGRYLALTATVCGLLRAACGHVDSIAAVNSTAC